MGMTISIRDWGKEHGRAYMGGFRSQACRSEKPQGLKFHQLKVLVTWPHLAAREAGKCSLVELPGRRSALTLVLSWNGHTHKIYFLIQFILYYLENIALLAWLS